MGTLNRWWSALALVCLLGAMAAPAWADPAADLCGGAKLRATGKLAKGLSNCAVKAMRKNETPDADCVAKATGKLGPLFGKAEGKGGCATTGDAGAMATEVDAAVDGLADLVAPMPDPATSTCAAFRLSASGKYLASRIGCYAKGARRGLGPSSACLDRAAASVAKGIVKAEARGGCDDEPDAATLAEAVENAAAALVALVSPVCGDAIVGPTQLCEIGDDAACPGLCTTSCVCEIPPVCGDGLAELPEECDDANTADGDGCSSSCTLEDASALCAGVPSSPSTAIDAVLVGSGLAGPTHVAAPPLDPSRLFIVERAGRIRILDLKDDTLRPTPFLDIASLVRTTGEGGLLSMAFHPDYATNRRFFVNYTNVGTGATTIARYEASVGDPHVADPASARLLLVIAQPFANHNGGQIAFGPDGFLYVGMGDGGGGGDPLEAGQDDTTLLGKMLRLDVDVETAPYYSVPTDNPHYVDGSDPLELIWAKGLRNPWRFSFDRSTGDLLIADVGQNAREEIDWQDAASPGGGNYGWDIFEGSLCFEPAPDLTCPDPPLGFTMPIHEYTHAEGCSISGGFVYRGCGMPALDGEYFYSDFCSGFLRTFSIDAGVAVGHADRTADAGSIGNVVSFGEDARGEIYVMNFAGALYRLVAE
jgi:cysteine-rich repeat protein